MVTRILVQINGSFDIQRGQSRGGSIVGKHPGLAMAHFISKGARVGEKYFDKNSGPAMAHVISRGARVEGEYC